MTSNLLKGRAVLFQRENIIPYTGTKITNDIKAMKARIHKSYKKICKHTYDRANHLLSYTTCWV